jgi:hypothetical protein
MSENRNASPVRVASGDIVERIRSLRYVHVPVASQLMEEAVAEIERLRNGATCPHVRGTVTQYCSLNLTLTDEEREAVAYFAVIEGDKYLPAANTAAATLRSLLERLAVE